MSTIFALSSGQGRAGVSVFRLSGPESAAILTKLTNKPRPAPRQAVLRKLYDQDELIDQALCLYFQGPHSFTGEDVVELHVHGSLAVIQDLAEVLVQHARLAEPGEFSKRAFLNGKMDLTEVEGLGDLIDAETRQQKRQALRQMQGELSDLYDTWREQLIKILAHVEAYIDFPDEDLPTDLAASFHSQINGLKSQIAVHLQDHRRGERLRHGLVMAIIGPPNAGKSSFLNYLTQKSTAIVSDIAGTTRDVIEARLDYQGYPILLADTAGLRASQDVIEQIGIHRAKDTLQAADLIIFIYDLTDPVAAKAAFAELKDVPPENILVLANKSDLAAPTQADFLGSLTPLPVSLTKAQGLEAFHAAFLTRIESMMGLAAAPSLTRVRHRQALLEVESALTSAPKPHLIELMAEDLRLAVRALGQITGRIDVEDILDRIFKDFCLGK